MRKYPLTFLFVFVAQVVVCFGQDPQPAESQLQTPAKSIIRGRVVYEDTMQPVRRGLIGLLEITQYLQKNASKVTFVNETMSPEGFVLTDDNGEFEIRDVKVGTYYPFVRVRNVINPQSINSLFGNTSSVSVSKLDVFFNKINVDGINEIHVIVPVKRGAAMSGSVLYADGTPAIGVKVKIFRKGSDIGEDELVSIGETETDDRGYYRRVEMLPGTYFVEVSEPSDHAARNRGSEDWRDFTRDAELKTYYPGVAERKRAGEVKLEWGQEAANTDIQIPERKLYKISGKVVAKDNQRPLANVRLAFERIGDEGPEFDGSNDSNEVRSDDTGSWAFKDLPAGKYRIKISPQKYRYYYNTETHDDELPYAEIYKDVVIVDTDVKQFLVELPLESSLAGTIRGTDIDVLPKLVSFQLVDRERRVISTKTIKIEQPKEGAQGKKPQIDFRIGLLSAGTYAILAEVEDDESYVKSIRIRGRDVQKDTFTIKESEEITGVEVIVSGDAGTLSGIVYATTGKPAPLTNLLLMPTDADKQKGENSYYSGWTNSLGEFRISVPPGEYFVVAGIRKPDSVKKPTDEWIKDIAKTGTKVKIKPNEITKISLTVLSGIGESLSVRP